jgi:tetratricopeptide (TPR) repeat protein
LDQSLAILKANLYLETKDYESFDYLATSILELDSKNAQLASNFGLKCEKEFYYEGAEYYYKKAIAMNPLFTDSYINLSTLLIGRSNAIDSKINSLGTSDGNKMIITELKLQKEQILKDVQSYLQEAVNIAPFNSNAKQLMASVNITNNVKSNAFVSGE